MPTWSLEDIERRLRNAKCPNCRKDVTDTFILQYTALLKKAAAGKIGETVVSTIQCPHCALPLFLRLRTEP